MKTTRTAPLAALVLLLAACATQAPIPAPEDDLGLFWVKHAAEYEAVTRQVYGMATRALPGFIADKSWSALPWQTGAEDLPVAVILDVDETVINNVDFQINYERPFDNYKLDFWDRDHTAQPVPGVVEFVRSARAAGVTTFFLTNRPCEQYAGEDEACPQKQTVIKGLEELGIPTEPEFVSLAEEQQHWKREKLVRRQLIGESYRVIMVIGDDLGDFVPCVRKKVVEPCTAPGTRVSRAAALDEYAEYWGNGWYILPNPMHGSWTSVR
ncbi:MAG: HAD family acid phosphatase [Woeseiaceae bacterium]|jgi:acid phosphatase